MDTLPSEVQQAVASGRSWLVSSFRLRARLDVSIPSAFSGQRGYEPRFLDMTPLIWAPEGLQPSWTTRCSARTSCKPTSGSRRLWG